MKARPGLKVQKYGRTTGHTHGEIESINTSINVTYGSAGSQIARFTGQSHHLLQLQCWRRLRAR